LSGANQALRATAYRTPLTPDTDPFAPEVVTWVYSSSAVWTLRAVLTIERPGTPGAPGEVMSAPPACRIPMEVRRPVTIRPTAQPMDHQDCRRPH